MGNQIDPVFEELFLNLNEENQDSMKLFAGFLLAMQEKKEQGKQATKRKGKFLEGLAHIPIPVDNLIIDRAEIYADRI